MYFVSPCFGNARKIAKYLKHVIMFICFSALNVKENSNSTVSYEDPVLILSVSFLFSLTVVKTTPTQSPGPIIEQFTLNFTITNLRFTTDLGTPNSAKFNSTEKIMQHYVSQSHCFSLKSHSIWGFPYSQRPFLVRSTPCFRRAALAPILLAAE